MHETDDMALVREYAASNSEQAFATLVDRYINLVYSAAFRRLANVQHAEEVTQAVFIILARKACGLRQGTILSGWLYQTAQLTSANFQRAEYRRQRREQEAHMQFLQESEPDVSWERLAPFLEDAMAQLGDKERNAIILRFFENRTVREVATVLDVQEDAAQKRVNRATDKLRRFFDKRGIKISAGVLAGAIGANSIQAAPVGLASTISVTAAAKGAAISVSSLVLIKTTLKIMAWTKMKTAAVVGAALLLTTGATIVAIKVAKAMQASRQNSALGPIKGSWEGTAQVGDIKTRLVLKIVQTNGTYRTTLDSIDQSFRNVPIDNIVYDKPKLRIELPVAMAVVNATVNLATDEISGTWKQGGINVPLLLKRTTEPDAPPEPLAQNDYAPGKNPVQGFWQGTLKAGQLSLRLNLKLAEQADGTFRGELDSIDQGANVPVTSVTYEKPALKVEVSGIGGVFEGKLNDANSELAGTWTQMGNKMPLTFKRGEPTAEVPDVEGIFDYTSEADLQGHWKGTLDIKQAKMRLRLEVDIAKLPDGKFSSTMISVDQGGGKIPASTVRYTPPNVFLEWKGIGGSFKGKLEKGKLTGSWYQGAGVIPFVMERNGHANVAPATTPMKPVAAKVDPAKATCIDLKPYVNATFAETVPSKSNAAQNNLAELPKGLKTYAGVPFDAQGMVQLMGNCLVQFNKKFPTQVSIPIAKKCRRLHVLNGSSWVRVDPDGTGIAQLILHYADGSKQELKIISGQQVLDWWGVTTEQPKDAGTQLAWAGSNPNIKKRFPEWSVRLYKSTFENPQPETEITSVDYESLMAQAAPFMVGLTVD